MMSECTAVLFCLILFGLWFLTQFHTISFYSYYHVLHYEDQKDMVTKLSGHCVGKDCAIIPYPRIEECNVTGVICSHEYSIPFNIQTHWISK